MVSRTPVVHRLLGIWLALAAAAMLGLAGCGSSGPTQPGPGPVILPPTPTPTPTPTPGPPPTLGVTRILAFGDSMTEGVDSPPPPSTLTFALTLSAGRSQSYPFKLQALMTARYTAQTITVVNAGIAGRNAREDRDRFNRALSDARPELVLLLEGANDLNAPRLMGEGDNARIRATVDALEDMVRDAGGRGIPVMIGTLPPQRPGGPKSGNAALVPDFNAALVAMAAKKGAGLVDINTQLTLAMIGIDGLHPTEAGYQKMAEAWLEAIKAVYERPPAPSPLGR